MEASIRDPNGWWAKFSKRFPGTLHGREDLASFESFMKLSWKTYNYIRGMVKEEMMKNIITDRNKFVMSLNERVAISLRWLSSGESKSTLGKLVGVRESTVSELTWCFVEAMRKNGKHHIAWPSSEEEIKKIKSMFKSIACLPNCCGAIETTKFMFWLPSDHPFRRDWCDGENIPSMVLQAIVGPDMRFLDIHIGPPGSLGDSNLLCMSSFFNLAEKGQRLNGEKLMLTELKEYIVGDVEYPLLTWLITPYQEKKLSYDNQHFNDRHYETRKVAKQALTRLKGRWRAIQGILNKPDDMYKLHSTIYVCCLLHNIMIDLDENEGMQDEVADQNTQECQQQNTTASASAQRDKLSLFLSVKQSL